MADARQTDVADSGASGGVMFYVIGAQKCGTTWLHRYFEGHSQVSTGPIKEYSYFNYLYPSYRRGAQGALRPQALRRLLARASLLRRTGAVTGRLASLWAAMGSDIDYKTLLRGQGGDVRAFGDISPNYALLGRDGFAAMKAMHPQTRFVLIMRDPVARLWSQLRMDAGMKDLDPDAVEADRDALLKRAMEPRYWARSDYARTVAELEAVVPQDDILYLFYETLFTPDTLDRLCAFLGVDSLPAATDQKVFASKPADMPHGWAERMREKFQATYDLVATRFGAEAPPAWGVS